MNTDMNMQMQGHLATNTSTIDNNVQEAELESPPPAFDSFAWLAIGLSIVVGVGSVYYFKKSSSSSS